MLTPDSAFWIVVFIALFAVLAMLHSTANYMRNHEAVRKLNIRVAELRRQYNQSQRERVESSDVYIGDVPPPPAAKHAA